MIRRTLVITTSYPRWTGDPSGHFVRAAALELAHRGDQVTVIAPGKAGVREGRARPTPQQSDSDAPLRVLRVADGGCFGWPGALPRLRERPIRSVGAVHFAIGARRLATRLSPDRIVAHWLLPGAFPIAFGLPAPLEIVAHGSDVRLLAALPGARWLVARLLDRGARLTFVSHELQAQLGRATGLDLTRATHVAPSPVDTSQAPSRREARKTLALADDTMLALVVGRLVESKRIDRAIELARSRAELVVVLGDGPLRAELESRFGAVRFEGLVPRPMALTWLRAADLLVSASRLEGAPTVVREARALGVRVLATPSGDLVDWARHDPGIEIIAT